MTPGLNTDGFRMTFKVRHDGLVIPVLRKLRQEDDDFETSMSYVRRLKLAWAIQRDPDSLNKQTTNQKDEFEK